MRKTIPFAGKGIVVDFRQTVTQPESEKRRRLVLSASPVASIEMIPMIASRYCTSLS
jgi:hypothetical protein